MRRNRRNINGGATSASGFLLVDKPEGLTSRKVVDIIRYHARYRGKIGHSGTLDPLATGLLVLCLGRATRLANYLIRDDKSYSAVMKLGVETDTGDAEGRVIGRNEQLLSGLDESTIVEAFDRHRGVFSQVPPSFSARKVRGRRAYDLARRGQEVVLKANEVEVKELKVIRIDIPLVHFFVKCSSGTYIRSLAVDVGRSLGAGAHLTSLRRLVVGPFSIDDAERIETLKEECRSGNLEKRLFPPSTVLERLSRVVVDDHGERLLRQGAPVAEKNFTFFGRNNSSPSSGEEVQVWSNTSDFLAVGKMGLEEKGDMILYPAKVLA